MTEVLVLIREYNNSNLSVCTFQANFQISFDIPILFTLNINIYCLYLDKWHVTVFCLSSLENEPTDIF